MVMIFDKIEVAEFESFYKKDDMIKLRDIQAKVKGILKNMPENEKITNSELILTCRKDMINMQI